MKKLKLLIRNLILLTKIDLSKYSDNIVVNGNQLSTSFNRVKA